MIYKLLDFPPIYRLAQRVVGAGGLEVTLSHLRATLHELPPAEFILDVGCGPMSLLSYLGLRPVGIDLQPRYITACVHQGGRDVVGSADVLPFAIGSFNGIWRVGLFHHIPDEVAKQAIDEMVRVGRPKGYIGIIDAVLPNAVWKRPLAAFIRYVDRGRYMRSQTGFESLFPCLISWKIDRYSYTATGLQFLICILIKA